MAHQLFSNNGLTLLQSTLTNTGLSFTVLPGSGNKFPQPVDSDDFFLVTLQQINLIDDPSLNSDYVTEIVKVISRVGDTFIIDANGRGMEGTPVLQWDAGNTIVDHRITAGTLDSFYANSNKSAPIITNDDIIIPTTITDNVDVFETTATNRSVKWVITLIQPSTDKVFMFEVLAIYKPSDPNYTIFGKVGDKILHTVSVTNVGTSMILTVHNNESSDIIVKIMRLQHT